MDTKTNESVEQIVDRLLQDRLAHFLDDISFRISQAYELIDRAKEDGGIARGRIFAEDLRILDRAFMTGYTVTNNSPAAGAIAWADVHIVYNGTDNVITNGNTTNRFIWWSPTTTPTTLQTSNTKPTLAQGEVLVFMNNAGIARVMLSDTNTSLPGVVSDGAVDSSAILANAVTATQLADGAVGNTQLAANAVGAGKIASGAVNNSSILGANVVAAGAISDGAVNRTGQLGTNVVTGTAIADNAVTRAGQLAANVVTGGKLADGAVNRTGILSANTVAAGNLADGAVNRTGILSANTVNAAAVADGAVSRSGQLAANVVTSSQLATGAVARTDQLGANVVTNTAIASNAVGAGNIQTGVVDATKLNVLRHFLV